MRTELMSAAELRAALPMHEAINAVRDAFLRLAAGEFEMPVRTALGDGRFLIMNAFHSPTVSAVVKTVNMDFDRRPAVEGLVTWTSSSTSTSYVLDAGAVTSLRTGAVVGVATDALAPVDARDLVLIGLGGQAPDQLRAVRAVRSIERVTLVDRDEGFARAFADRHADDLVGLEVHVSTDPSSAVSTADVVCCATPSVEPLFAAAALPDRVHVNAIGAYRLSMRELPDDLLSTALLVVDQREAALEESGEIHHAMTAGLLAESDLVELSDVLREPERVPGRGRTVFKSVGLAVQDWAIGYALAVSDGLVGREVLAR
jgi:ornithine cyclodeaminase/alanine dehydrogenase-like protein (mu-crystallin family)